MKKKKIKKLFLSISSVCGLTAVLKSKINFHILCLYFKKKEERA